MTAPRAIGLATLVWAAGAVPVPAQVGDVRNVPDPAIIKAGSRYYIFSTGPGVEIRRSDDLWKWERVGTVFDTPLPSWAEREVPGTRLPWAPDISYFNGRYHLYYALSTFGGQRSVIGLATNRTLDRDSSDYRWVDQGKVLESNPGRDPFNAIDPAIVVEDEGRVWLAWGSFWGGIKMRRIEARTGMLSSEDTTIYSLAARAGVDAVRGPRDNQAIEGAYIIRHEGSYYLFVSFDACCRGAQSTYNVRVGRSAAVTGPYTDRDGVPMTAGGGTLLLAGSGMIAGPGHNAILAEGGRHYIVHHYVNVAAGSASPGAPLAIPRTLQIRPLYWAWDGWPIAGAPITGPQ